MPDARSATVQVRLRPAGLAEIDRHAQAETEGNRSMMIRKLVAEALTARQARR